MKKGFCLTTLVIIFLSILNSFVSVWAKEESGEEKNAGKDLFSWKALPDFPDGIGVALPYTGVSNGALVIAGGTHFEGKGENRKKVWTDSIYVYEKGGSSWKGPFNLKKPLSYGASVNIDQGMLCMGGSDPEKCHTDVYLLEWIDGKIRQTPWPNLPAPCMYIAAALVGDVVYVAGGQQLVDTDKPTQTLRNFWALDLSSETPAWKELEPWPGPGRILPVAASQGGSLYLFSGTDLIESEDGSPGRKYLKDAYRYSPEEKKWTRLADSPRILFAAASPAFDLGESRIAICGGYEGVDTGGSEKEKAMRVGLFRDIFIYNTATDTWSTKGEIPSNQIVTNATKWGSSYVIPSGEVGGGGIRNLNVYVGRPR